MTARLLLSLLWQQELIVTIGCRQVSRDCEKQCVPLIYEDDKTDGKGAHYCPTFRIVFEQLLSVKPIMFLLNYRHVRDAAKRSRRLLTCTVIEEELRHLAIIVQDGRYQARHNRRPITITIDHRSQEFAVKGELSPPIAT